MGKDTFYDILGVAVDATTEQIKKKYKVLALKCHPDKNLDNVEEATKKFNLIQEAYNVLSDPKERDWYDRHKEAFHNFDHVDIVDHSIDEVYFTTDCFTGFNDTETGFYSVYRRLFDEIIDQEAPHKGPENEYDYPRFGNSKTDLENVKHFYDMWQSFSTAFSFAHLDKYDIREAPNRRVVRLMQKENKKIRDDAKKNRNSLIQELVQFVRKRDKRMDQYRKMLEAKVAENRKKSENHRRKVIEERNKSFSTYVETGWTSLQGLENELKVIEASAADYYDNASKKGKNKKKKNSKTKEDDEAEENEADDTSTAANHDTASTTEQQKETTVDPIDDLDDEEEEVGYYCAVCNKKFKTINSFQNHEKSKKHLISMERFNAQLAEDEEEEDGE